MRRASGRLSGDGLGWSAGVLECWSDGIPNTPPLHHSITPSPPPRPLTIVGGGLAGLALGIGLRQQGIPVTVWEAGHYPRHRVCGEFISGRGQDILTRLGLLNSFYQAGAVYGHTAAFYLGRFGSPVRRLATPALCLPRYALDALLATRLREEGGELREDMRWRKDDYSEGVVRATGRRLQAHRHDGQWFGMKVHAHNVPLAADLEMHGAQTGYIGLCRLAGGVTNVCGLFRGSAGRPGSARTWRDLLRGQPGTPLWERLENASFDDSTFCAVAGFSLKPHRAVPQMECCLGDALTMIPPVTGNGMSMAFEAAELAIGPLVAYSRGESSWSEARLRVAEACDRSFARRLAWARVLQWLMFTALLRGWPGAVALHSGFLWRSLYVRTR